MLLANIRYRSDNLLPHLQRSSRTSRAADGVGETLHNAKKDVPPQVAQDIVVRRNMHDDDTGSERDELADEEGPPIPSTDVLSKHVSKRGIFKSPDPAFLAQRRDEIESSNKRLTGDRRYVSGALALCWNITMLRNPTLCRMI